MIIRNEMIVSAKYLLNPISPRRGRLFPLDRELISCRQATFQTIIYMRIIVLMIIRNCHKKYNLCRNDAAASPSI